MNKVILLGLLSIVLFGCSPDERPSANREQNYDNPGMNRGRGHSSDTRINRGRDYDNPEVNRGRDFDNTGVNVRDRDPKAKTSFDQFENERDRTVTQKVRQAIVGDDSLSSNAKNIKIITQNGVVTLRGPIKSANEKNAILSKVNQITGVIRVDDQLDIEENP